MALKSNNPEKIQKAELPMNPKIMASSVSHAPAFGRPNIKEAPAMAKMLRGEPEPLILPSRLSYD